MKVKIIKEHNGMPVKDIVPSQKEAEKIFAVIQMFIKDNQIRLNELICD